MKAMMISIGLLLTANVAHAGSVDWQDQLAQFKQDMQQDSTAAVVGNYYLYAGTSAASAELQSRGITTTPDVDITVPTSLSMK
jgi:hypothetical protein